MEYAIKIKSAFEKFPAIKLAYFFGSRAEGKSGPLADYDFAVFLDEKVKSKYFEIKTNLMGHLSRILSTEKIDVVVLNTAENPELKYRIIKYGKLIYEKDYCRVLAEPRILNEYFDFIYLLRKYNLTNG